VLYLVLLPQRPVTHIIGRYFASLVTLFSISLIMVVRFSPIERFLALICVVQPLTERPTTKSSLLYCSPIMAMKPVSRVQHKVAELTPISLHIVSNMAVSVCRDIFFTPLSLDQILSLP